MTTHTGFELPWELQYHCVPDWDMTDHVVLDIGCNEGQHLTLPVFSRAKALLGIDVKASAVANGLAKYPHLQLQVAFAEDLPYPDRSIDTAISKVALPYSDIRAALTELHRVVKPGSRVLLTMHDWRLQWLFFAEAVRNRSLLRVIDHAYIAWASFCFAWFGYSPRRPYSRRTRESWQTRRSMRRELERAGFEVLEMRRNVDWAIVAQRVKVDVWVPETHLTGEFHGRP